MEDIETILKRNKKGERKPFKSSKILTKLLLSVILVLGLLVIFKIDHKYEELFTKNVLTDSLSFMNINNWYQNNFGSLIPLKKEAYVFSNNLNYYKISSYLDGEVLEVASSSVVANINGGIVVFIGEKEGYGNVVIIQGNDGYDIWYGNLTNISVSLYDYLEKETVIGQTIDDKLYLVIKKDNNFYTYEEYQSK